MVSFNKVTVYGVRNIVQPNVEVLSRQYNTPLMLKVC